MKEIQPENLRRFSDEVLQAQLREDKNIEKAAWYNMELAVHTLILRKWAFKGIT